MTDNNLNAGAASFTPGFTPGGIDEGPTISTKAPSSIPVNNNSNNNTGGLVQASTATTSELPAHLKRHAAEFWFPECRECPCCKGFKHGCDCAPNHGGACASCGVPTIGTTMNASASPIIPLNPGGGMAPVPGRGPGQGYGGRLAQQPPKHYRPVKKTVVCKFFRSPNGCRFGDSCRFAHE